MDVSYVFRFIHEENVIHDSRKQEYKMYVMSGRILFCQARLSDTMTSAKKQASAFK